MKEIWKDIPEYEQLYKVSNLGNIKSLIGRYKKDKEFILKNIKNKNGYLQVNLCKNKIKKIYTVHSLVLKSFCGKKPYGMETRHLDGNRHNNKLDNLKWGTKSENQLDKKSHGTFTLPPKNDTKGSKNGYAKLNENQVKIIKKLLNYGILNQMQIAEIFKISNHTICSINKGKIWKHIP